MPWTLGSNRKTHPKAAGGGGVHENFTSDKISFKGKGKF